MWDLTANACSFELVPDGKNPIRSITVATDASTVVASNNRGTCFVWNVKGSGEFEPIHKIEAHGTYCLSAVLSPDGK